MYIASLRYAKLSLLCPSIYHQSSNLSSRALYHHFFSLPSNSLKVLLAPNKIKPGLTVHVTLDMQLAPQHLGTTEENPGFGGRVDLADAAEDHVPVGPAEVGGRAQARDGVVLGVGVVDHDVGGIVVFDLGGEVLWEPILVRHNGETTIRGTGLAYGVDFDVVLQILSLNRQKERAEPLKGAEVTTDPEEVDFPEASLFLWVVHSVPDALEDGGEWCDTNTCATKNCDLVFKHVF